MIKIMLSTENVKWRYFMEENKTKLSEELLQNISIEQLADLKIEVDDLVSELKDMAEDCEKILKS